jgi:hypothetical protein
MDSIALATSTLRAHLPQSTVNPRSLRSPDDQRASQLGIVDHSPGSEIVEASVPPHRIDVRQGRAEIGALMRDPAVDLVAGTRLLAYRSRRSAVSISRHRCGQNATHDFGSSHRYIVYRAPWAGRFGAANEP